MTNVPSSPLLRYFVFDAFPDERAHQLNDYAGAVAGCWIRLDAQSAEPSLRELAEQRLGEEGWRVGSILSEEDLSGEEHPAGTKPYNLAQQALVDGFAVNLHLRKREFVHIGAIPLRPPSVKDSLAKFLESVRQGLVTGFYSTIDAQWANGVTADEDEFVPLFSSRSASKLWEEYWERYEPRALNAEFLTGGFLEAVNSSPMWVGLQISNTSLMMHHPISLLRLLHGSPL
jgi:hypothetical protein